MPRQMLNQPATSVEEEGVGLNQSSRTSFDIIGAQVDEIVIAGMRSRIEILRNGDSAKEEEMCEAEAHIDSLASSTTAFLMLEALVKSQRAWAPNRRLQAALISGLSKVANNAKEGEEILELLDGEQSTLKEIAYDINTPELKEKIATILSKLDHGLVAA